MVERETGLRVPLPRGVPSCTMDSPSSTNPPLKHQTPAGEARGESASVRPSACQPLSSVAARYPRARLSSRDTGREPAFSQPQAQQVNAHSHSKLVNMFFKRKTIFKLINVFTFPSSMVRLTDFHKRRLRFINYLIFKN